MNRFFKSFLSVVAVALTSWTWAAEPVAVWTDFNTLTSGSYTLTADMSTGEEDDGCLLDVVSSSDAPRPDELLSRNESLAIEVQRVLSQLEEREREVLQKSFGIGCSEMTLEEIAEEYNLTRERVRQIKEKAVRRLKGQRSQSLIGYLG